MCIRDRDTYEQYIQIRALVQRDGIEATIGPKNALAVTTLEQVRKSLRSQMFEFGMTPSAASVLDARKGGHNEDPMDSIMAGP